MNKSIQMKFYNKLRQTNPVLAKSKEGRSMIMDQAVYMTLNGFAFIMLVRESGVSVHYHH